MSAISRSQLWKKRLGDWVINPYVGCEHGCYFCYCPSMPGVMFHNGQRPASEWGKYVIPRENIVAELKEQLRTFTPAKAKEKGTEWGGGYVLMSFLTDCYQPKERELKLTRECLKLLLEAGHKVRIQTRSVLVMRDLDILRAHRGQVLLGTSIPSVNTATVRAMEPRAAGVDARWRLLDAARDHGLAFYVAIAPVMPWTEYGEVVEIASRAERMGAREIFCEVLNPKGSNLAAITQQLEALGLREELESLVRYDNARWAYRTYDVLFAARYRRPSFIPWPDTGRQWAKHLTETCAGWLDQFLPAT